MASSAMNSLKLRLTAAIQSERLSRSGPPGAWPTSARSSVAVDKAEAADLGHLFALSTPSEDQPHRGADAAGEQEAGAERARRDRREVRAHLPGDVRGLIDALAERLGRGREVLALRLQVAANVGGRARVVRPGCHRSSTPPSSASPPGSPAPEPAACPS